MSTGAGTDRWGLRRAGGALLGRQARLRWVHLVLGGALLMPYWMLSTVLIGALNPQHDPMVQLLLYLAALGLSLPMAAVTALVPTVRALEGAAARASAHRVGRTRSPPGRPGPGRPGGRPSPGTSCTCSSAGWSAG